MNTFRAILFVFLFPVFVPFVAAAQGVGRVEDAFTHEPIANAEVVVVAGDREAAKAVTGADGAFAVAATPREQTRVRVRADGYAESIVDFTQDNVTVLLYRGVPVRGLVTSGGQPIAGASVSCRPGVLRETEPVFTNSSGRFYLACPSGHVHLVARAKGKGAAVAHLALKVEGESQDVIIDLRNPVVLEGRVLDDGKPIAGVDVMAYPNDEYLNDMPTVGAVTDKAGRFRIEPVGEGMWKLAAYTNYRVGVVTDIAATRQTKPAAIDIALEPALPIDIKVTVGGEPVPGAPVKMGCNVPEKRASLLSGFHWRLLKERGSQAPYADWIETTDRRGIARFPTRMKGSCWVSVDSSVGRGGRDVTTEMRDATLELLPAASLGSIRGRVEIAGEKYSGERSVTAIAVEKTDTRYVFAAVKADGTYEIANVSPGRYTVNASDRQLTGNPVPVTVVPGKPAEAILVLSRQSDASGRVVDATTKRPLSRVTYVADYRVPGGSMGTFPPRITDAEGRFTLDGLRGKLGIVFFQEGYRPKVFTLDVPAGGEIDLGSIEMTPAKGSVPTVVLQTKGATVGPGVDPEYAEYVVRKKLVELDACYQQALVEAPDLHGTAVVRFVARPENGYALDTKVKESTIKMQSFQNCVWTRIRGCEFGKTSTGAETVIEYGFEFANPSKGAK